ncbi:MAG: LicD family protein [Clostridiales bacterium]|nr:LicD family protein [Clostridiales bacterium]
MSELVQMTPELLRELQLKQLDALVYFRDFCDKNNLKFYLIGGALIGALRNGGFVPWDDDIDVIMPRPDYEKLHKLWREQKADGRFRLLKTDDEIFTGNIFITITDTNYTMVKANQVDVDIPHGLVLDVFPLDVCPDGGFARKMQYVWTMLYSLFLAQIPPENHGGLLAAGSKALLSIFRGKSIRNKIWRFCERKMSKYKLEDNECVTELCSGPYWMKKKYPKHIYAGVDYVTFEGLKIPCMSGYDEYLTMIFGDYMKLPPEEERIPHHDIAYLDLNTPCIEYDSRHNGKR